VTTLEKQKKTPAGLYPRLLLLAASLFVVATNGFVIAGLLPDIADTLGVHVADVGYAITYYAVVVAIASPAVAILFARRSRTALMVVGIAIVFVGMIVAAAAPSLPVFILGRVIAGLGGAAVVPVATVTATALAPEGHRGRAIGFVMAGFTAATAFGAPAGTALAAAGGWRAPLFAIAGLAFVVGVLIAILIRRVPIDAAVSLGKRFGVLANRHLVLAILTSTLVVAGLQVVYIFSSSVLHDAINGDGSLLAVLLFAYGVAGLFGNSLGGQLVDRIGPRRVSFIFLGAVVLVLAAMPFVAVTFPGAVVVFAVWGFASSAAVPAVQYRLITIDPSVAGIALSWNSTALYLGIAVAPLLGAAALHSGGASSVPIVGAIAILAALTLFQLSWLGGRRDPLADLTT
jgi:predicted MFS family arabinose efflux permease